jgi:hypothetical protein
VSVIRGKIFLNRYVIPSEVTVGGEWPFKRDRDGKWVTMDGRGVRVSSLTQMLRECEHGTLVDRVNEEGAAK